MWKKKFIASKWEESKGVIWTLRKKKPSAICHLWSLGFSITFYASFLSSLFLHEMILVFTMKGSSWEPTDSFSKKGLFIGSEIFFQHRHSLVICVLKKRWKNASCHEEETKGDTACYFGLHKKPRPILLVHLQQWWWCRRIFYYCSPENFLDQQNDYFSKCHIVNRIATSFPSFPFDLLHYGELKKNHKFPISQLWFVHYYPLTPILLTTLFLSQRIFFMAFSSSRHGIQSK